jgi:CO/xanthine dehydrogenase FAD-binding subunit
VIPATFEYERAGSVEQAVELLGRDESAKLLAGGHSLIPLMRLRLARPSLLVDIGRLDDLRYVREDGDRIAIGALTRHAELVGDPVLARHGALLSEAAALIGDPQVRHRGTIGGAVAHGYPVSDLSTIMLTLDADFVARGPDGERTIPAAAFFTGAFDTALGHGDVPPRSVFRRSSAARTSSTASRPGLGDRRRGGSRRGRPRTGGADGPGADAAAGAFRRASARGRSLARRRGCACR